MQSHQDETSHVATLLSFSTDKEDRGSPDTEPFLQAQVLEQCQSWHEPVLSMARVMTIETIWGVNLMDRQDPNKQLQLLQKDPQTVVLGEAFCTA